MSRKFVTERELAFISNVTKELLQGVVEEKVRYYAISVEESIVDRLYNEAIKKVWSAPVEFDALVHWDQGPTIAGRLGMDATYNVEIYAHKQELVERNIEVREGDFVEYGGVFFEITSATQPQIVFGQVNNKVMVRMACVQSREGQFVAGGDSTEGIAHDHPIENVRGTPITNPISTDA